MKPHKTRAPGTCPPPEAVVAFVMDGTDNAPAMDDHIAQCEACQRLAAEAYGTRDLLRTDTDRPVHDLTAEIMGKLPADAWEASNRQSLGGTLLHWRAPLRIAAALAILLGATHLLQRLGGHKEASDPVLQAERAGQQWLLAQQQPSGGWDAATLGGHPEYAEALNGLAVMAIIIADTAGNTDTLASLDRAGDYLLTQQSQDGRISRDAGAAMYNHGIATLALLEIDRLVGGDTRLDAPIDEALAYICRHQSPAGGWGYRDTPDSPPNTSITAWQVKALLQARAQGRDVPVAVLRKALNWMAGTVGPQGYFGYEGPQPQTGNPAVLTMMGAHCLLAARDADLMRDPRLETSVKTVVRRLAQQPPVDYHQAYFVASVIGQLGGQDAAPDASSIRSTLLARQIKTGADTGAWQSTGDRWAPTGGKLYTTAMAMLALAH